MELSVIETAGLSLETLVESLKKSDKFCSYNQRQQCRIYRDIFINCYNFIELFYKALLIKKDPNIKIKNIKYHKLIKQLNKNKIINNYEEEYIYCVKEVRNRINHNAYSITEVELLKLFKCMVNIIPKIKDKNEELNIEKGTLNWISDKDNLFKILLILKPKIYRVIQAIKIDRVGAVRSNNYFLSTTTKNIDKIVEILCEKYKVGEKSEIKSIVELLIECYCIRDCYDYDEDTGEEYINGISVGKAFIYKIDSMNNFVKL